MEDLVTVRPPCGFLIYNSERMSKIKYNRSSRHLASTGTFGTILSRSYLSSKKYLVSRPGANQNAEIIPLGVGSFQACVISETDLIATDARGQLVQFRLDR